MTVDVVIVGAGPVGLMLAAELRLAGVAPLVLERLPELNGQPKSNGLIGRIIDVLDYRGLLDHFVAAATYAGPRPIFEFGGIPLDQRPLGPDTLRRISIPQYGIERLLNERAEQLGAQVRRGHEVLALTPDEHGVSLDVRGPDEEYQVRARYVVGADGGRSLVRKQAGIGFPGNTNKTMVTHLADVDIPDDVLDQQTGDLLLPGVGRVRTGLVRTGAGAFAHVVRGGIHRVAAMEWDANPVPGDRATTLAEVSAAARRVIGAEIPMSAPKWLARIVDNSHQADRYRAGRILLVGDAAHVHSSLGGPGLNLGLQDAVNLGWKLAGLISGWAGEELLDSYEAERHPVGQRVLMYTMAQTALLTPGEEMTQIRGMFAELLAEPAALRRLIDMFAGTDVRYDFGADAGPSPLAGRWAPDFQVVTADGGTRVAELMRAARPVLLDLGYGGFPLETAQDWKDRVDLVAARHVQGATERALLIRPDGYVAWACMPDEPDEAARPRLRRALTTWFGAPGPA
jgi:2-polyprenyl-6-methoxyphenol hydroxylase-like FAD-dependent oxidoreductase